MGGLIGIFRPDWEPTPYCRRCGEPPHKCRHGFTVGHHTTDPAHAARIRARYALGRIYNPDHDTTSYTDCAYPDEASPNYRDGNNAGTEPAS